MSRYYWCVPVLVDLIWALLDLSGIEHVGLLHTGSRKWIFRGRMMEIRRSESKGRGLPIRVRFLASNLWRGRAGG
jgi:hypothetical protein